MQSVASVLNSFPSGTFQEIKRLEKDLINCIQAFPTLQPTVILGLSQPRRTLCLNGTVPVEYQKTLYHFPVQILIPESYPHRPPQMKVVPTSEMKVLRNSDVDAEGNVLTSYMRNWSTYQSTLAELVVQTSLDFARTPPLGTRQATTPPPPPIYSSSSSSNVPPPVYQNPPPPPPSYRQAPPPPINGNSFVPPPPISNGSASSYAPPPPITSSAVPPPPITKISTNVPPPPITTASNSIQPTLQNVKSRLNNKLRFRCEQKLPDYQKELQMEMETEEKLVTNGEDLKKAAATLKEIKHQLESQISNLTTKSENLRNWLIRRSEEIESSKANIEDAVQPGDDLGKQIFNTVADALAIDDTLYQLNSGLSTQKIDLKTFLKQVRNLSREHFLKIALAMKLNEAQTSLPGGGGPRPKPAGHGTTTGYYPSVPQSASSAYRG